MKTLFGAIVVDGRGKLGGHVASKKQACSYFRTKVSPSQPASQYSANVRARFTTISQAWRGLLEASRKFLWNNAVQDFKGDGRIWRYSIVLPGVQIFTKVGINNSL